MRRLDDTSEGEQQAQRLQALIDSSPLALVEFGLDTRIRLWNPAAERIFGWSAEEMLGRGGLPMAPPSKRAESEELFTRVRAGESLNDYETVRQHKDGTLVAVSIAAAPVREGSGRVIGNMVAYTDITERTAEAEVHRLNAELHARLDDLAASRARIVTAGDVERRRLERNLHDGAQQRLVALSLVSRAGRRERWQRGGRGGRRRHRRRRPGRRLRAPGPGGPRRGAGRLPRGLKPRGCWNLPECPDPGWLIAAGASRRPR